MQFSKVALLTFVLIAFLLGYPLVEAFDKVGGPWLIIFSTIVPIATIYAIGFTRHRLEIALSIGVPFIMVTWFHAVETTTIWTLAHSALALFFYLYVLAILIHRLLKTETVNSVMLLGAVSTYLLLGIFWSELYSALEFALPGSFGFVYTVSDFIYYSFSTLTTLGMGDITPLTHMAKSLTVLESAVGMLFVTVLIARLVGVYVAQTAKREVKEVADDIIEEKVKPVIKKSVKKTTKKTVKPKPAKRAAKKVAKKKVVKKKAVAKKTSKK